MTTSTSTYTETFSLVANTEWSAKENAELLSDHIADLVSSAAGAWEGFERESITSISVSFSDTEAVLTVTEVSNAD